jgi:DNA-binding NtrC family response regulator
MRRKTVHLRRALFISDHANAPELCRRLTDSTDVRLRNVSTFEQAEAIITHKPPHMAILDYRLCGAAGVEKLRPILAQLQQRQIPLILITEWVSAWELEQFESLGVFASLESPFQLGELANLVREAAKKAPDASSPSSGQLRALS